MAYKYCPHCGEDVQVLMGGEAPAAAASSGAKEVIRREVTTKEKDRLWGLLQLPVRLVPIGVLVDESKTPIALVLEDPDKRFWAGTNGEVKLLGELGVPDMPAPPVPGTTNPATVPSHLCNTDSAASRAARGSKRYGQA